MSFVNLLDECLDQFINTSLNEAKITEDDQVDIIRDTDTFRNDSYDSGRSGALRKARHQYGDHAAPITTNTPFYAPKYKGGNPGGVSYKLSDEAAAAAREHNKPLIVPELMKKYNEQKQYIKTYTDFLNDPDVKPNKINVYNRHLASAKKNVNKLAAQLAKYGETVDTVDEAFDYSLLGGEETSAKLLDNAAKDKEICDFFGVKSISDVTEDMWRVWFDVILNEIPVAHGAE